MANTRPIGGESEPEPNDIEGRDTPVQQAPGYNETERSDSDPSGDADQVAPSWRPGDGPASAPVNAGMQGEGEPGRAQRDSTGVEGAGAADR